jgi:hypothetical protein
MATTAPTESTSGGQAGGIGRVNALALGTLKLEGTDDAVTPAQAAQLLPLWQIIQSGSLKGQAETDAVLAQIEDTMTESQRAAIEAMALTGEDVGAWMREQGIEVPQRPGDQGGGPGAFQNLSEDERAKLRQEFQNITPEQRATRMAEMGIQRPQGGQGGGSGGQPSQGAFRGGGFLVSPVIELLTARAAE